MQLPNHEPCRPLLRLPAQCFLLVDLFLYALRDFTAIINECIYKFRGRYETTMVKTAILSMVAYVLQQDSFEFTGR